MATIIAFVVYVAAAAAMAGALYLWRALSVSPLEKKLAALALKHAKDKQAHDDRIQVLEAERANERRQWISEFQQAREHIDRLRHELTQIRNTPPPPPRAESPPPEETPADPRRQLALINPDSYDPAAEPESFAEQ